MTTRRILTALAGCATVALAGAGYLWATNPRTGVWADAIQRRLREQR